MCVSIRLLVALFSCPQSHALVGGYGSYLLSRRHWPLVFEMISTLRCSNFSKLIFVKIRLLDTLNDTLELVLKLQSIGCDAIAIHGRKRGSSKHRRAGCADLETIRILKSHLKIPVIANGNIRNLQDAMKNLETTQCEGVMSAEGILANPRLFNQQQQQQQQTISCIELAHESHTSTPDTHMIDSDL